MKLICLDLETTGLTEALPRESILELAAIVVEAPRLTEVARFHSLVKPDPLHLKQMDPFVVAMHTKSGLLADLAGAIGAGTLRTAAELEPEFKVWLLNQTEGQRCYLMGSNPEFDRAFLRAHMPNVARQLHYRNFDVNSFHILREMIAGKEKTGTEHRAMADCEQAIRAYAEFLNWMRDVFKGRPAA
jgi:oligoribonuclease (3'-5' exoribonuclease)